MITFKDFQDTVESWLPEISAVAKQYFNPSTEVSYKEDHSPVTVADKTIEQLLKSKIAALYPTHLVLGEESGLTGGGATPSPYKWIIDPIDGTQSFIHGVPLFSTLIALTKDDEPIYGAIYLPILGDVIFGDNNTALYNGVPVKVRECNNIEHMTMLSSGATSASVYQKGAPFYALAERARCFRTWGDGYGYMLVATGRADVMIDPHTSLWDSSAIIPIIRGASGHITDYQNHPAVGSNSIIAANSVLHAKIVDFLENIGSQKAK